MALNNVKPDGWHLGASNQFLNFLHSEIKSKNHFKEFKLIETFCCLIKASHYINFNLFYSIVL